MVTGLFLLTTSSSTASERATSSVNSRDDSELVAIAGTSFMMGADGADAASVFASPAHRVEVGSFWIYKHEVSLAHYQRFVRSTGRTAPTLPHYWSGDWPVTNISWDEAVAYCAWAGARLPTEAQWECAARGSAGGRYTWGSEFDPTAVYSGLFRPLSFVATQRVVDSGELMRVSELCPLPVRKVLNRSAPDGPLHMLGNVAEWCQDEFDPGDERGLRSVRGGSYLSHDPRLKLTTFARSGASKPSMDIGFRPVVVRPERQDRKVERALPRR